MNEEEKESLWQHVLLALESSDEDRVISLSQKLSDAGDWRGSSTLGYVFENQARRLPVETVRQIREKFIEAAHWYIKALSQGGQYAPHYGLAAYYYYGLGGKIDFKLAYEHLKHAVEEVPVARIMMGELLFLGLGVPKDVNAARKLFSSAAEVGYPAALIGLSRIEKSEKHFVRSIFYYLRALRTAIKLVTEDKDHPLLAGTGRTRRTFRLDGFLNREK